RAGQLADLLAAEAGPVSPDAISAPSPIQRYFGVRGAALTVTQLAAAEATIAARGLSDLSTAPVALGDVVAELRALLAVVDDFRRFSLPCSKDVLDGPSPATGHGSAGTGLQRWIIGHHVYFMLNIRAAAMLRLALQALSRGDESATVSCINTAVMYARGFTAAMAHASAISPKCYQDQIRPTMAPPDTSVPLTGRMHKEHRAYRSALGQLLAALSEPYSALAERSPALAEAREVLLDADLVDIERHILLAGSLVGGEPSLVRNRTRDSAVSMLREMRTLRAAQYYPLVRSGDRAAAQSAAATHRRFATPEVAIKPVDGGVNGHNLEVSTPSP
ncbi:MAG: hypothetical protein ACRD3Q_18945, partial [Terriglobales bacterium]